MNSILHNEKSKEENIKEIIASANFLHELLKSSEGQNNEDSIDEEIAKIRLKEWMQTSSKGDQEVFNKRLERDNLTIEQVLHILGIPSQSPEKDPEYVQTLQKIVEMVPTIALEKAEVYLDKVKPLPFQDVLIPLVLVARYLLLSCGNFDEASLEKLSGISKTAYLKLEYGLLHRLAQLTSKTLLVEFSSQRSLGQNKLLLAIGSDKTHISTIKYNSFVKKHLSEGFLSLFKKYPVLARLITTIIGFWVEATREFLNRLEADLPEIKQLFNREHSGKVINITTGLSDAHNYGKSVLILTFEDGFKLVYKPKDLSLEIAYNQFLQWCNVQQDMFLPLKIVKVLNRGDYGWMEHIEQLPCTDQDAARRFYQRAGMLLCLLYVLNTNDCHYENLIAHGEHLVLIDGETVMHHTAKYMEELTEKPADFEAYEQMIDSPINTGFLPTYILGPNNIVLDWSALGGIDQQEVKVPKLQNINTDQMFLGQETVTMPRQKNVLFLNGQPISPNDHIAEILEGYEQMYNFFIKHKESVLIDNGPLAAFSQCSVRFLNRATRIYAQALEEAASPKYLKDGRDFSIQLEILTRAYLITDDKPHNWSILAAELEQIHRCDIPFFTAKADSEALVVLSNNTLLGVGYGIKN